MKVICILKRLIVANIKVVVNKYAWVCYKVIVIGFKNFKGGINPNPAELQGINDLKLPENVSEIKKFWEC